MVSETPITASRPAPEGPPAAGRFRADIEGLRAVAVLLVVADHAGLGWLSGGYVGVDVFFVISGFLITLHLSGELRRTGRIDLRAFYGRRAARLLPAATVTTLATLAAAWTWLSPSAAKAVALDALTAAGYALNVRLAVQGTDYLTAQREPSPLQHFWSLAVEEQFYLVWPLLLLLVASAARRRGRRAALALAALAAVSFAVCVAQTGGSQPWAYFGLPARAWELAAGALLALAADRLARLPVPVAAAGGWLGLGAIAVAALRFDAGTAFPGAAALLPVAGAALVVAGGCARPARGAQRLLRAPVLQAVGRLSYGWYLWHWPVLVLAPHVAGHELDAWARVLVAAASLVPASLSLRLVEGPVRFHPLVRRRPRRGLALGAAFTAVAVAGALLVLAAPKRVRGEGHAADTATVVSQAQRLADARLALLELVRTSAPLATLPANLVPRVEDAARDRPRDDRGCLASLDADSPAPAVALGCDRYGDPSSATTVVLFGDSHTEQWFDALDSVARLRHWRLVVLTKSGCTPAEALTIKINARRPYTECGTWREAAFRLLAQLRPALVLISTRTYTDPPVTAAGAPAVPRARADEAWAVATVASAQRIRRLGARPVILQDTPDPRGADVPDCVAAHPAAVRQCALRPAMSTYPGRRDALAAAAGRAGIGVIDPTAWFCTDSACPAVVGNVLVYRDGSHVTASYVRLLTPLLTAVLT